VQVGKTQVNKKQIFNADQWQMHAKHAGAPERIVGGLPFARYSTWARRKSGDDHLGRFIQPVPTCVFCVHLLLICVENLLASLPTNDRCSIGAPPSIRPGTER
jgi:hypothetical protein